MWTETLISHPALTGGRKDGSLRYITDTNALHYGGQVQYCILFKVLALSHPTVLAMQEVLFQK